MIRSLDLKQLGSRINTIDKLISALIAHRMGLALNVGAFKQASNPPIPVYNAERERSRLEECRNYAQELGVDPDFMSGLLYSIIGESCKQQMIQLQGPGELPPDIDDDGWHQFLKSNLLSLTKEVAPSYGQKYSPQFFASNAYQRFEGEMLGACCVGGLFKEGTTAVDLGCATGYLTAELGSYFEHVIGYDISPDMIEVARRSGGTFEVLDLEQGVIPLEDSSVSFVVMNLGTGSDVRGIDQVINETERILAPGGNFLFSFYNADALVYQWDFLPWPLSLAAELNRAKNCLDVHIGKKIFSVYARAYSTTEVRAFFSRGKLKLDKLSTFPTVSAILPEHLFADEPARQAVLEVDRHLADAGFGAYIVVTGRKEA